MPSRRSFVKLSVLGSAGMLVGSKVLAGGKIVAGDQEQKFETVKGKPIVISTWDFGKTANKGAWEVLSKGGRSLDAVETGVKIPEADPTIQTIGYGGLPDRDGHVTLDACIMDENYNCGSVMCMENIVHAVSVARLVMERTPHVVLAGEGAGQFAVANGFKRENLLTPESEKEYKEWLKTSKYVPHANIENTSYHKQHDPMPGGPKNHDTIGMVAMDTDGNMGGACSTSGMAYKMHGRVGDSPIIGAGLYVDNEVGAATATGVGEEVIRIVGSHLVVELMRQGLPPEDACKRAVERIIQRNPKKAKEVQVGFVALNKKGEFGAYSLQTGFTYSVKSNDVEQIFPSKSIYQ